MLCVIEIQNVFCQNESMRSAPARRGSLLLYEALKSQYQMIALSPEDEEVTRWWLKKEHLAEWSLVKTWDREVFGSYHEWAEHEISLFLAAGWEIGLYVDTHVEAVARAQYQNVPTMLVSFPERGPGFYDPDRAPRAWADISATVDQSLGGTNGPG